MKIFIEQAVTVGSNTISVNFSYYNSGLHSGNQIFVDISAVNNNYDYKNAILSTVQAWAVANSLPTVNVGDLFWATVQDAPVQSAATRSLNSAFQVSATQNSSVAYSVDITSSLSLTGGTVGTVFLEICATSGFSSGVQTLDQFTNGQTGTLTIGLALSQIGTANLTGFVPAGYYTRLRTSSSTGTATFAYQKGQEVIYSSN